jgi:DNA-binding CsgD family transcriptional regulator
MLTGQDYKDVINLAYVAQLDLDSTQIRHNVLSAAAKAFRVRSGIFFLADGELKRIDPVNLVTLNIEQATCSQYAQHYWRLDPVYRVASFTKNVVFRNDDILPRTQWFKLKYYTEFQQLLKVREELVICLRHGTNLFGMIDLLRSEDEPDFDYRDMSKANILAPCITAVLQNAHLFLKTEQEKSMLSSLVEFSSKGIAILDYELRPVYCNHRGKEIFLILSNKQSDQAHGMQSEDLGVPSEIVQICRGLKKLCRSGGNSAPSHHGEITFARQSKRYHIECSLVQYPLETPLMPYFLVSLEQYHLTKRETEIAQSVAAGLTNKEIAEKFCISQFTVETHLKNIFEKIGIRNRTELATYIKSP